MRRKRSFFIFQGEKIAFPDTVLGIDFSGSQKAGNHIWIARGQIVDDQLIIRSCQPASQLPNSSSHRQKCLPALRHFIAAQHKAAIGIDFPFSIPQTMMNGLNWVEFVNWIVETFSSPEALRSYCRSISQTPELKRQGDIDSEAPFSPYNLWVFRQTYYGIKEILHPLVKSQSICVLPMMRHIQQKPWCVEACPASFLKQLGIYLPYKGKSKLHNMRRQAILQFITQTFAITIENDLIKERIINNSFGDALDSVLAAIIVFRQLQRPEAFLREGTDPYATEGRVYF